MNDLLNQVHCSDNIEFLRNLPDDSIDSIVTDPPYGLSFMGKKWDYDVPSVEVWAECLRVLKPGGHLLAFAGTRTQHRMAVNIEDAGFEIRDMIAWVYGSGFPKSLDVSKAIDKAAGAEREVVGLNPLASKQTGQKGTVALAGDRAANEFITTPATDEAHKWNGWGTALKPALEPITVARKPIKGTVAENVLKHGTGAINVDGCRVEGVKPDTTRGEGGKNGRYGLLRAQGRIEDDGKGRFPANLIHDGSDEVVGLFPETKSGGGVRRPKDWNTSVYSMSGKASSYKMDASSGSAARFFYCAKASKRDRDEGCEALNLKIGGAYGEFAGDGRGRQTEHQPVRNNHPTVKPTDLMRYLCRLVTPPNGIILDPFAGSGSTGKAAILEYFKFIGIEREAEYCEIANARIRHARSNRRMRFEEDE